MQDIINKAFSKNKQPLSKKTLLNIKGTIIAFAKFLRRKNIVKLYYDDLTIPAGAVSKTKRILQPNDLFKLFSNDKIMYNGKEIFDDYVYAYRFAILTGLRPGELIGLKSTDIHGTSIRVQRSINSKGEVTTGKNQNAIRSIALTPLAYEVLQNQLELCPNTEYVFNINSQSTYRHRWQKFCNCNDVSYISLYEMRHTFVSIAKQLPEGAVKTIVGHSKSMDTFGIYGHEVQGEKAKTNKQLNSIFLQLLSNKNTSAG